MKRGVNRTPKWLVLFFFLATALTPALAQNDKKEKAKEVAALVQNGEFIFKAQTAVPMRGRTMPLSSDYDVLFSKDSVRTYLPYFGRAFMAQPYGTGEGGIKITSTDFNYKIADQNNKRWNIVIEPADRTNIQQLILNVTKSGYANLQVISTNRDPISFNGYIVGRQ